MGQNDFTPGLLVTEWDKNDLTPSLQETESEEEGWNSSEDELEHTYNTETGFISVTTNKIKEDENKEGFIKHKDDTKNSVTKSEDIDDRSNRNQRFENKIQNYSASAKPRASLTTSESDQDENIEIKQMKRIKRFKVPSILKTIVKRSNSVDQPDGINRRSKTDEEKRTKRTKLLPNLDSGYLKRFKKKMPDDIAATNWPRESRRDNPHVSIGSGTIGKEKEKREFEKGSIVRRTQSMSDAGLRPTSFKPKSMRSKFATLGRDSSRMVASRFSGWGKSGSTESTGSPRSRRRTEGSGQEFENIRYKVGQSSFYIFSDAGSNPSLHTFRQIQDKLVEKYTFLFY